jgi:hypothetical protein
LEAVDGPKQHRTDDTRPNERNAVQFCSHPCAPPAC